MSYTKTNWVDDVTPLSAQNLNKIEGSLENAHGQLDRLAYDVYNLYQEQYYTGNSTKSPSFGAAKSVFFDPINDTTTYNTADSSVYFVTDNTMGDYVMCAPGSVTEIIPTGIMEYPFNGFVFSKYTESEVNAPWTIGSLSALIDGSISTKYASIDGSIYDFSLTEPVRLDLGSTKLVTGLRAYGSGNDASGSAALYVYNTNTGVFDYIGSAQFIFNGGGWGELDLTPDKYFDNRFLFVKINIINSQGSSRSAQIAEIHAKSGSLVASTYKSNPISLGFTPTHARAYISTMIPAECSILPKIVGGSGALAEGTQVESRQDPNFSAFTEITYEFDLSNLSSPMELDISLIPSSIDSPKIKRYGLYFY